MSFAYGKIQPVFRLSRRGRLFACDDQRACCCPQIL